MVEFYGGRTPLFNRTGAGAVRMEDPRQSGVGMGRGMFNGVPQRKRNFSALNQPSGYSSLGQQQNAMGLVPNQNISFAPSNRQQINKAKNRFSALNTNAKSSPNQKNNLLDFIVSPQGKGIAQGLLEASGYSDTPVSFGQALSQGMARGNEAQARVDEQAYKQQLFNFQKEQFEETKSQNAVSNFLASKKLDIDMQNLLKPQLSSFTKSLIQAGIDPSSRQGVAMLEAE